MENSQVTIVVVPRERFSFARESLESIYQHTQFPFNLVYVDGNSPAKVRTYLQAQAQSQGFQLIRTNSYLSPNQARNIGLSHVKTKYVVFIDNDVVVTPGWLKALVQCAEETGATVVGPLTCENEPLHERIHCTGGDAHIATDVNGERHLCEKIARQGQRLANVREQLQRTPTELAEFHCMLVRTEIFEKVGKLDEAMLSNKEHVDFCMTVAQAGGTVYFEPESLLTYVPGSLDWNDIPFYMLRWSDAWQKASLDRLREKWNLPEDKYFQGKYKNLGWRRKIFLVNPLSRRLSKLGLKQKWVKNTLNSIDNRFNRYLTKRYAQNLSKLEYSYINGQ